MRANNSYRIELIFVGASPLRDFLAISVAAIVGANFRYFLSRLAAKEFGPVFPYGTLNHKHRGKLHRRLLRDLDVGESAHRSTLATLSRCGILRIIHDILQLRLRNDGVFRAGQWGLMLANFFGNNLLCLGGALGRAWLWPGFSDHDFPTDLANRPARSCGPTAKPTFLNCFR